jgi:hypothetical protein
MSKDKRIPWNKGKTGLQVAWNKGLKGIHLSPSSEFKKGHHNGIGRILSDITKRKIRTEELKEKGYKVLRLWESDIVKMDVEDLRIKLDENTKD